MSVSQAIRKFKNEKFIFGDIRRPLIPKKVNLMYWKTKDGKDNVGDLLSKIIFDYMLDDLNLKNHWLKNTYKISVIGSIIQAIKGATTVWGSGLLTEARISELDKSAKLDIRAVRGPESKRVLENAGYNVPEVFGDPAILLPKFYEPKEKKIRDYVIIPHFSRLERYAGYENIVSTLTSDWQCFIDSIVNSKFVISSSLHGVIIAEAYGIPAILLDDLEYDLFKYNDYYMSTGRKKFKLAKNINEAFEIGPESVPDLSKLRKGLIDSFPKDLFN